MDNILDILPANVKNALCDLEISQITEIRLRVGKKIYVKLKNEEITKDIIVTLDILVGILKSVSLNSIYSIQNNINQGFVTTTGGCRIGVVGEVVVEDGKIKNIKNISSMNIRVAHEIIGASDTIVNKIYNNGNVKNCLIVSPPGFGKTTILRDLIRQISNLGKNIGVIDERGEIANMNKGVATLDVGDRTDIISYIPKPEGVSFLLRSMGLDVIATDEIGSRKDTEAIKKAIQSGIKIFATAHGSTNNELSEDIQSLINEKYFDILIYLSNDIGKIQKICNLNIKEEVF